MKTSRLWLAGLSLSVSFVFSMGILPEALAKGPQLQFLDSTIKTSKAEYSMLAADSNEVDSDTKFIETRINILTKLATALEKIELGFGSVEWLHEKWVVTKSRRQMAAHHSFSKDLPESLRRDIAAASQQHLDQEIQRIEDLMQRSFKERSRDMIQSILRAVDKSLVSQKNVVAHANEFGVLASIGSQFVLGSKSKGIGGTFAVGISMGFNKTTGAFFIDIFRSLEKFENTIMKVTFSTGIVGKAGLVVRSEGTSQPGLKSKTFYPPAIPGYSTWSPSSFSTGLSTGLTLPPSPLGDLITYQTETQMDSLMKIQVSRVYPMWFRVTSPFMTHKVQVVRDSFSKVFKLSSARKCSLILNMAQ